MKHVTLVSLSVVAIALVCSSEGLATVFRANRRLSGFSPDSRYYVYLESFQNPVTEVPTAKIQIIEVANNSCVRNGCLKTDYDH